MYGHLDMIKIFYEDNKIDYGIFCEDDIFIHKDFDKLIPNIIEDFRYLKLDVLLLGYLCNFKIDESYDGFNLKDSFYKSKINYAYHNYTHYLWGTQMYMLSKENAKKILEKYDEFSNYAIKTLTDNSMTPFSSDWTITKDGNRALIYPCLAVEYGKGNYDGCYGQYIYHKNCHEFQYDPNIFI